MKITVDIIKPISHLFMDLKGGDTFIFEPNRVHVYTVIKANSYNLYSRELSQTANAIDHEGKLYSFSPGDVCRKVDVELKVIIKE